ncbi:MULTISPECIES: putative bifunctional diguanylate cyclase/phosphodiesterase [Hyphomonas]|jgi:diguanylate cyclase (GGDEF)-like protein|uniref:putative bifunctional diguanylate cyclase/phosphodiesterase n=1 Tax=Hyphomonas TaxID=85 RepID=UPI003517D388
MKFRSTSWKHFPPLSVDDSFDALSAFFVSNPEATLCPVVDRRGRPNGFVSLQAFQRIISNPYGYALNQKRGLAAILDRNPLVLELNDDTASVFSSIRDKSDLLTNGLILVHDDGVYAGCLNALGVFHALTEIHANMLSDLKAEIVERERAEQTVRQLADTDPLTRILNRRAFIREVEALIHAQQPFTCALVDLDRFKPLNDRYGHAVGDHVLKELARRLSEAEGCRLACRLGGDEFAFVICDADASEIAARAQSAIVSPIETDLGLVSVGASIGLASYPNDAVDEVNLMYAADKAMIRIKSEGGGIAVFDRRMDLSDMDAQEFDKTIISAVKDNRFQPAVQPILDLRSHSVAGYEVLARWPNSGLKRQPSPKQFMPPVERLGLIDSFFWSMLNQALRWLPDGRSFLSFNVSPSQLTSLEFSDLFLNALRRHKVEPSRIELEITENVLFRNIDTSKQVLGKIVDAGVSLALDDFGTGYSSLSLLEELPFKKVKLDKSLLGKKSDSGVLPKVLTGSLKMCREMNLISCAEGVETSWQLEQLAARKCDLVQGFLIGRAVLCKELTSPSVITQAS